MKSFKDEFTVIKRLCQSSEYRGEIEQIKQSLSHRDLVLYGAGVALVSVAKILKCYGVDATCFCDKNKTGIQKDTSLSIISPQTLVNDYTEANILISALSFRDEIVQDLRMLGIAKERILPEYFFDFVENKLQENALPYVESHIDNYEYAFGLLHDDTSKEIFLSRLKCCLTPFPLIPFHCAITASPPKLQYLERDIITLSHDEVFVDGGMYTGDTAEEFFLQVDNNYRYYYGFEPDNDNYDVASNKLAGKHNVTILAKGLWSGETQLNFIGGQGLSSKLDETGSDEDNFVDVIAFDTYFIPPTPPS